MKSRYYYNSKKAPSPNMPRSIGVVGIIYDGDKVLFEERRSDDEKWSFICGKVEDNESVLQALLREIKEGTGQSEWLYYKPKTKEVELFYRENQKIESHPRLLKKADMLVKGRFVRKNALFLSVLDQWNEEIAQTVMKCFYAQGLFRDCSISYTLVQSGTKDLLPCLIYVRCV